MNRETCSAFPTAIRHGKAISGYTCGCYALHSPFPQMQLFALSERQVRLECCLVNLFCLSSRHTSSTPTTVSPDFGFRIARSIRNAFNCIALCRTNSTYTLFLSSTRRVYSTTGNGKQPWSKARKSSTIREKATSSATALGTVVKHLTLFAQLAQQLIIVY